jgi:hypothetical protein
VRAKRTMAREATGGRVYSIRMPPACNFT